MIMDLTKVTGDVSEEKLNLKRIMIYLVITFLLTYGVEIFLIMPMVGSTDINKAYMAQMFVAGVMFIPAVSSLITRLFTGEKLERGNLMLSLNLKGNLKYYGLAWFGTVLLILFGTVLYFLIFPRQFDADMGYVRLLIEAQGAGREITDEQIRMMMLMQILMGIFLSPFLNFINCFGEEWGWRGYLLPKMLKRFKVVPTILITGVIWGLWHAPLTVMGHNYGLGYRGFPVTGIMAMCVFCIVMGILLSYVTIKTNSCIPAVLGHGTLNGFSAVGIYFTSLENPYNVFLGPAPTGLIGGAGFIITAAVLLFFLYKEEKQSKLLLKKAENVLQSD